MFHDYCLKWWDIGLIGWLACGILGLIALAAQVGREIVRGAAKCYFNSLQPTQLALLIPNTTASYPITYTNTVEVFYCPEKFDFRNEMSQSESDFTIALTLHWYAT